MTRPLGPTLRAAVIAGSPVPVAISSTRSPGLIFANSTRRLLTPCAARSNSGHHFSHPAAAASQLVRDSRLKRSASKFWLLIGNLPQISETCEDLNHQRERTTTPLACCTIRG